jgi:hypothetical protein
LSPSQPIDTFSGFGENVGENVLTLAPISRQVSTFQDGKQESKAGEEKREPLNSEDQKEYESPMPNRKLVSGDFVRVKKSVTEPSGGWGSASHTHIGRVASIDERKNSVEFAAHSVPDTP